MKNNPILDWELSIKLAGNDPNHAKMYLKLLAMELDKHIKNMILFIHAEDYENLKKETHQVLGALSYCGALRLKKAAQELHLALKTSNNIDVQLEDFRNKAMELIKTIPYFL